MTLVLHALLRQAVLLLESISSRAHVWYNSYNSTSENQVELTYFLNHDLGVKEKCDSIMVHAIIEHVEISLYDSNRFSVLEMVL